MGFLADQNNNEAFLEALQKGGKFEFALVDPWVYEWEKNDQDILDIKNQSLSSISIIKKIIDGIKFPDRGSIDLRITQSISINSFSSFKFNDTRSIRVYEFNTKAKDETGKFIKYSQIFDESPAETNCLSSILDIQYRTLFQKSVPVIKYPLNGLSVYVIGLVRMKKGNEVLYIEEEIPLIKIESEGIKKENIENNTNNNPKYDAIMRNTILKKITDRYAKISGHQIRFVESIPTRNCDTYFFIGEVIKYKKNSNCLKTRPYNSHLMADYIELMNDEHNRLEQLCNTLC